MRYIADLHIHSLYSRATSKASNLFGLAAWAAVKGIGVVGTGDFTHPAWFAHLQEHLEPAEPGLYRLKCNQGLNFSELLPAGLEPVIAPQSVRFLLSAEISSIYKRGGKVRKVHNLLYAPDFASVQRMNGTLATIGNITSDGRPILGLDSRDLLEILLEKAPEGFLIPAHIWTPWFSLFGSKSGFDAIEDCFGDLASHIFALETGLSSDPEMNRRISALDRFTLISNSDCHSPAKLGREANIFNTELSYFALKEALQKPRNAEGDQVFEATVEFYPEEGKYHCDGHRKCNICMEPAETRKLDGLCPVCGKPMTIGVLHRVMELADRSEPLYAAQSPGVHSLIPLQEVVAELLGCGPGSKKVAEGYKRLIRLFGSEFDLLLQTPIEEIKAKAGILLAEAIERMRTNRVIRQPGFDGAFGVIRVFDPGEQAELAGQESLFGLRKPRAAQKKRKGQDTFPFTTAAGRVPDKGEQRLNPAQDRAVQSRAPLIVVQAGPGTGKTHTLVSRVQRVAQQDDIPCTVITFTNKAADEVRARLEQGLPNSTLPLVATFHRFCLDHLRKIHPALRVIGPGERRWLATECFAVVDKQLLQALDETLSVYSQTGREPDAALVNAYRRHLAEQDLIDLDCLVPELLSQLRGGGERAAQIRAQTGHLFVDEFQDVNQAQYELVAELARHQGHVFVIGDPDQAIYGFRGSDPRWFHQFISEFSPESHQLVCNYRSAAIIVQAAEALIANNPHPLPVKPMEPLAPQSGALHLLKSTTPQQEARLIAEQIEVEIGGSSHRTLEKIDATGDAQRSFKDIGVLVRTARQAQAIGQVLSERGLPFQLVDLEAYYTKGNCRLLFAWILICTELAEPEHLHWLLDAEESQGRAVPIRAYEQLKKGGGSQEQTDWVAQFFAQLAATDLDALSQLHRQLTLDEEQTIAGCLDQLMAYYQFDLQDASLLRFRTEAISTHQSLDALGKHLLHFSDSVLYDTRAEAITLSTLHAAKGLEFSVVFIAGVEEGLLPLTPKKSLNAEEIQLHLQEERRLFFVGMTRAVTTLYLSWSRQRAPYGGPLEDRVLSSFVAELPPACITAVPSFPVSVKGKRKHKQLSLFS